MIELNKDVLDYVSGAGCSEFVCKELRCDLHILRAKIAVSGENYDQDALASDLKAYCTTFANMADEDVNEYLLLLHRYHNLKLELTALRGG